MQDLTGRSVGQYQIVERLGQGGMATVYKGFQSSLKRSVAIKTLPPSLAMDPTFLERFLREATMVAGLQHPNILPVYDFGRSDELFYIVMMLVSGGTLREKIGSLSLETSLKLAEQVADALDHAHTHGIVHRDVKPTNVLMARDDWALLADFGIARMNEAPGLTSMGTGIGTPDYMSPEQAMGKEVDRRADIYSLGVMLYEMLTGKLPFAGSDAFSIMRQQVELPMPRPSALNPQVSPRIDAIVEKATAKDRDTRFQTAGDMKKALGDALLEISHPTRAVPDPAVTMVASGTAPMQLDKTAVAPAAASDPRATVIAGSASSTVAGGGSSTPPPASSGSRKSGGGKFWLIAVILGVLVLGCLGAGGVTLLGGAILLSGGATPTPARVQAVSTPTTESGPRATATPAAPARTPTAPAPTAIPLGPVLFQDNFANNNNGWDTPDDEDVAMYFDQGVYHIENTGNTDTSYVSYPRKHTTSYASFAYEADITKVDGPDDEPYGISFRAQGVDGYDFLITGEGKYQLSRYIDFLQKQNNAGYDRMIEWTQAPVGLINLGDARNKLKVVARGPEITVYINDKYVASATETKSEARKDGTFGFNIGTGVHVIAHSAKINALP